MKNTLLILLLFSLLGVKCGNLPPSCADTDAARIDFNLYDFYTGKDYFGKIGSNIVLPTEIDLYQEDFTPVLLLNCLTCKPAYSGSPWSGGYISRGYVHNSISIPYVERAADTKDSVGRQINRTFYLKIKRDIDTIRISYFMDNACKMNNSNMSIYYNDSLYHQGSGDYYNQINIYKK